MTHAVIYTRFSPRRNAEESESCEVQEQLCRDFATTKGWKVRAVHADKGVSGSAWPRDGLSAALNELRKDDVLLVLKRDRIARSVLISETVDHVCRGIGASVVAAQGDVAGQDDSPEATLIRQVLAAVAEYERKLIGSRTRVAMRAKQKAGQRVGRYAPYGYAIDPDDPSRLIEHPKEQKAIRRVLELLDSGLTPHRVKVRMDEEMPDACRGKRWSARTVEKIGRRSE